MGCTKQGACYGLERNLAHMRRYEREYGKGQRAVLKKVLEQDERASRAMILCIAEVLRPSSTQQGLSHAEAQQTGAGSLPCSHVWYGSYDFTAS